MKVKRIKTINTYKKNSEQDISQEVEPTNISSSQENIEKK